MVEFTTPDAPVCSLQIYSVNDKIGEYIKLSLFNFVLTNFCIETWLWTITETANQDNITVELIHFPEIFKDSLTLF